MAMLTSTPLSTQHVTENTSSLSDVITNTASSMVHDDSSTNNTLNPSPEGCLVVPFSLYSPWQNPADLVSYDTMQSVSKFVNVYMLTLCFFVSVPSNMVNMVVFWQHGLKERINLCLFCLSFADLITVAGHFTWSLDGLWAALTGAPAGAGGSLTVLKLFVNNMVHSLAGFIYVSGFLSTLVAWERCVCVAAPLRARRLLQTRSMALVIVVGHVIIMAGRYVIATRWRVVCMYDPLTGLSMDAVFSSQFYLENKAMVDVLDGVVFGLLLPGLYVSGIVVATAITVVKLRQMAEWREKSSSSSGAAATVSKDVALTSSSSSSSGKAAATGTTASKDVTLTRMLVGTSCVFVACTTPPLIFHAALPAVPELSLSGSLYNTYMMLINLQQLLTYLNASLNFFVYYRYGTKFRHSARALLRCQC